MIKLLLILSLAFLLFLVAGCAGVQPPREIKTETMEVKVPVPVPCRITAPDKPDLPVQGLKKDSDLLEKTKAVLAERELVSGYVLELEAAIKSCQ